MEVEKGDPNHKALYTSSLWSGRLLRSPREEGWKDQRAFWGFLWPPEANMTSFCSALIMFGANLCKGLWRCPWGDWWLTTASITTGTPPSGIPGPRTSRVHGRSSVSVIFCTVPNSGFHTGEVTALLKQPWELQSQSYCGELWKDPPEMLLMPFFSLQFPSRIVTVL